MTFRAWLGLLVLSMLAGPARAAGVEGASASAEGAPPALSRVSRYLGATYFTFFYGPGLVNGDPLHNPNYLGKRSDLGWTTQTNLSARLKVTQRIAIDWQTRFENVVSNQFRARYQGGRLGVSGVLLKGERWRLKGALNSDLPGVGQMYSERTLIADPGLFADFRWRPQASRWSFYSLVTPRAYFYRDRMAMDDKALAGGFSPGDKPLLLLQFEPSLDYALTEKGGLRLGMLLDFRRNANQDSIRRWYSPVDFGYTYELSERLKLYPYLRVSTPLDDSLRRAAGSSAVWADTLSLGMWIHGTLL